MKDGVSNSKAVETVGAVEGFPTTTFTCDFPFSVFPEPIQVLIFKVAKACGTNPEPVAASMLTVLSAAVGNSTRILVKDGWLEPPFIWLMVIGESGSGKSPFMNKLMSPIDDLQSGKVCLSTDSITESTVVPFQHYVVSDITVEALGEVMKDAPRGLLAYHDELSGFIKSHDQYKGKGNDRQKYLELWNCRPWKTDRVIRGTAYIRYTGCAMLGGIQTLALPSIFKEDSFIDGLLPRFTFSTQTAQAYSKTAVSEEEMKVWVDLVMRCYRIPLNKNAKGHVDWHIMPFTEDAHEAFRVFHERYKAFDKGRMKVFIPKLWSYAARIAGLLHIINEKEGAIDIESFSHSVRVVDYFLRQVCLILKIYDGKINNLNEIQRAIINCLKQRSGLVNKGKLSLENIRVTLKSALPYECHLDSQGIAYELIKLGFQTKQVGGYSYLIWEPKKIQQLFME